MVAADRYSTSSLLTGGGCILHHSDHTCQQTDWDTVADMTRMRDDSRQVACTPSHLDGVAVAYTAAVDTAGWRHIRTLEVWGLVSTEAKAGNGKLPDLADKAEQVVPWSGREGTAASGTAPWTNFQMPGVSDRHCWHSAEQPGSAVGAADMEPDRSNPSLASTADVGVPWCTSRERRCCRG